MQCSSVKLYHFRKCGGHRLPPSLSIKSWEFNHLDSLELQTLLQNVQCDAVHSRESLLPFKKLKDIGYFLVDQADLKIWSFQTLRIVRNRLKTFSVVHSSPVKLYYYRKPYRYRLPPNLLTRSSKADHPVSSLRSK